MIKPLFELKSVSPPENRGMPKKWTLPPKNQALRKLDLLALRVVPGVARRE